MNFLILCFAVISVSATATDDANTVRTANNRFATDVYKENTKTNSGNVIISPFSAEVVLSLLDIGCEGSTFEQLTQTLRLPNNKTQIKSGMKSILSKTNSSILNTANGVFVQQDFKIKKSFQEAAIKDFFAETENLNFSNNEEAANTINKWVEDKTNNTINNLISPNDLNAKTRVVLVNAVHFLAKWSVPFPKTSTSKDQFYKTSSDVIQVDFIHNSRKHFNYFYCSSLQVEYLQLFFEGNEASMIFIVPKNIDGLAAYENQISNECLSSIPFKSTYINVAIPKFKFDNTIKFTDILKQLNVTKIFDPNEADLSGIAGKKGDLIVSTVIQKAFIDVSEGGVEASAATAVVGAVPTAVILDPQLPINFVANRPFLFLIFYQNITIFSGRVSEPLQ